jgi:hypothetical protein
MIKKYISLFAVVLIAATLTVASCNPFAAKKDDNNDTLTLLALAAVALQDASYEINFNLVSGSSMLPVQEPFLEPLRVLQILL